LEARSRKAEEGRVKVFDSGMPSESYWNSLFDIPVIIDWLDLKSVADPIAEIGCGYGTFTVAVARQTTQMVHAFDIEPAMIQRASENTRKNGSQNVAFYCRDVIVEGTGLPSGSMGLVLLFNILHSPEKAQILRESSRILKESGRIAILHWRKDIPTPRGPRVHSRPDLDAIVDSITDLALRLYGDSRILEPYHWGVQLQKGET
jgi:SAM-dependent methyltransferase